MRAIATFEHRSKANDNFDRQAAKKILKGTVDRILETCRDLEYIASNPELSEFLKRLFASTADRKDIARQRLTAEQSLSAALGQSGKLFQLYRNISPRSLAAQLMKLEPLLNLAVERVELQPGDFQRDEIAQEFCNELAYAWISGTGKIPTISEPNKRTRSPSAFLRLLELLNNNIDQTFYHPTAFRNYGAIARDHMRLQFPELELEQDWDPASASRLTVWEAVHQLIRLLESGGEDAAASIVAALGSGSEAVRDLAYRLYSVCERRRRAP